MENAERNRSELRRWRNTRGLTMITGIIVMIVVLVLVAAGGYFALNSVKPSTTTKSGCWPASSTACQSLLPTHDVSLFSPFHAAQTGTPIPFTAVLPETASSYSFNFGDGSPLVNQTSPSATHAYAGPGSYIASVQANVGGTLHDNYLKLLLITVTVSYGSANSQNTAPVIGLISSNSTPGTGAPTAVLQPGGSVTVTGAYSGQPTNPSFVLQPPKFTSSGGTLGSPTLSNTSGTVQATFANPGPVYTITFVGSAVSGSTVAYLNYTWTVFVPSSGVHAAALVAAAQTSPHPGSLQWYELAPGGGKTEDPSISYDTSSGELVFNVYSTLIAYNGTLAGPDPTDFVPSLAACVPGSGQCQGLFGNTLVNPSTGAFTFVLSSTPTFYDPKNPTAKWGVYPSDVMFTFARTLAFSDLPFVGASSGWIPAQGLLPFGDPSFDSGLHFPFDTTPKPIMNSMLVNSSQYCPSIATSDARFHGCITFLANGGGTSWPFFLEFVADFEGGSVEPCGWFSAPAQASIIPGWTDNTNAQTKANQGDHPCLLPGGAKSTDDPAFTSWVNTYPSTGWDSWQQAATTAPYVGNTQYAMVGTGPYYLANLNIGQNYLLKANPNYQQNPFCTIPTCFPKAGTYAKTVSVTWESTATLGEQALQAGQADHAGIPSTDASTYLEYIQQGKIVGATAPTISIDALYYNMNFDQTGARQLTTNPINVPSDFFSHIAIREFMAHAYPYQTIQSTVNTVLGIQYVFSYGGAIPQFMGNYYPRNISWPTGDPPTSGAPVGSAQWWWQQGTTAGSPFYDPEMAACTSSNPCQLPLVGQTGAPDLDLRLQLLANSLSQTSGGAIKVSNIDINFNTVLGDVSQPPGKNPLPLYRLGWAPDYPDPTDYIAPFYMPDNAYTAPDAVAEKLGAAAFNQPTYPGGNCFTGVGGKMNQSDVVGYAHMADTLGAIPEACQGEAYSAMVYEGNLAAGLSPGPQRVLEYNFLEHIANGLALYIYTFQVNTVTSVAPWIDPTTIIPNIMVLGSLEWDFSHLGGNGVAG